MSILRGMKWIKTTEYSQFNLKGSIVTIGNFDGLHLGHRVIMEYLIDNAKTMGLPIVVIGFDPHPRRILCPQDQTLSLFSKSDLVQQLTDLKVDFYVDMPFTKEIAQMSAATFFETHIVQKMCPKVFVVGHDFAFGRDREGGTDYLKFAAAKYSFLFKRFDAIKDEQKIISSSLIRNLLKNGNLSDANRLLGRIYYIDGDVVQGSQLGRNLGIPTANINLPVQFHMAHGVYKTQLEFEGLKHLSVTNIGTRPTVATSSEVFVETHAIEKKLDLYGKSIRVCFEEYLRPEKKFSSIQDLKNQIQSDIARVCS